VAAKKESFSDIVSQVSKKYDLEMGSLKDVAPVMSSLSTGNLAIDEILGVGGFPVGRVIELYGPPSSGKSTCAAQTAAWVQRQIREGNPRFAGKRIVYMDHEQVFDVDYARALGLDVDDEETFLFAQPKTLEQSANVSRRLVATGDVALIIYDSVAEMMPSLLEEKETGEATMALRARLLGDFLSVFNPLLQETQTTAIFINHLMEVMSVGGRPGMKSYSTPGGRSLKFYSSVRVSFQQIKQIKGAQYSSLSNDMEDMVEASDVKVKVEKNKVAKPFKTATVRVRFGRGFDNAYTALQILIGHKQIVKATGGYYYFHRLPNLVTPDMPVKASGTPNPYIRGDRMFFDWVDSKPEWAAALVEEAQVILDSAVGDVPVFGTETDKFAEADSLTVVDSDDTIEPSDEEASSS
jgi:recombination protein RecA